MNQKVSHTLAHGAGPRIAIRCPECGHKGVFESIGTDILDQANNTWFGQRRCPAEDCYTHIFYIHVNNTKKIITYPYSTIEFNKDGIPPNILSAFEEAVKCHSIECYVASAITIRKTLEEICADRQVTGDNLKQRLKNLSTKIFIPKELTEGMDELRLLGNDAAHIESNTFNQIGKMEIEISIEFAKEILKGVYQYEGLLSRLRSLKKE